MRWPRGPKSVGSEARALEGEMNLTWPESWTGLEGQSKDLSLESTESRKLLACLKCE